MIPLATTTITTRIPAAGAAPGEPLSYSDQAQGVRAHFSAPAGNEQRDGSQFEVALATLTCDPTPLDNGCRVLDELTGDLWEVTFAMARPDLGGLGHVTAQVQKVTVAA